MEKSNSYIELYVIFTRIIWSNKTFFTKKDLINIIEISNLGKHIDTVQTLKNLRKAKMISLNFFGLYSVTKIGCKMWLQMNQKIEHEKIPRPFDVVWVDGLLTGMFDDTRNSQESN